ARTHGDRGQAERRRANVGFIIQAVATQVDIDHAMVDQLDIFITSVDDAVIIPVAPGPWYELVDRDEWRRRNRGRNAGGRERSSDQVRFLIGAPGMSGGGVSII